MTLTAAARLKGKRTIMEPRTATGGIDVEQKNLDIYGSEPIPWSRALKALERVPAKPEDPGGPTTCSSHRAVIDAAVRVGWTYLGERLIRGRLICDEIYVNCGESQKEVQG